MGNQNGNKWFYKKGGEGDIAVSTRARLARNIEGIPMGRGASPGDARRVVALCSAPILENPVTGGEFSLIETGCAPRGDRLCLMERHLISPDFAGKDGGCALLLSKDEGVSIMINEEDHIRLQVLGGGLCPGECLETARRFDELIDEGLEAKGARYAFDGELGYLTRCPTNLGTGLRASVMLHLPALTATGEMKALVAGAGKLGLEVRGYYGEGSPESGGLYQVSNRVTLGSTEEELVSGLEETVRSIIQKERERRAALLESRGDELRDKIFRAKALLESARLMSEGEARALLSDYRLGVSMGIIEGDIGVLNGLNCQIGPAETAKRLGGRGESPEGARAALLRESLAPGT